MQDSNSTGRDYIVCRSLYFTYGQDASSPDAVFALKNIDLTVKKGEFIAIVGRNSSGKSTLAKLFSLVVYPSLGSLVIDGVEVGPDLDDRTALDIHRRVGMVFQNPDNQLIATLVDEDIAFGLENLGYPSEEIKKRVESSLAAVGLSGYEKAEPSRLSGGQKRKVAIACILSMNPEALVLDEPLAGLDRKTQEWLVGFLLDLKKAGKTLIVSTHNDELARTLADRLVVMGDDHTIESITSN